DRRRDPALVGLGLAPSTARADHAAAGSGGLADGHRRFLGDLVLDDALVGEDVALVDPDLHADATERLGFGQAVVDVGAQGVQRHPALAVPLLAAHLGATEPAAALHAYTECAGLHRGLDRALHCAAERDAAAQLVGD